MKGTVAPASSSSTAARTCCSPTLISAANCRMICCICGAPEKTRSARVCHTPHAQRGAQRPSPGIAQPCGNPVDRDVDSGLHALIILAGTPAAHQFDLQMVQRVDVCKAVL